LLAFCVRKESRRCRVLEHEGETRGLSQGE
jgi:hypothetical protein